MECSFGGREEVEEAFKRVYSLKIYPMNKEIAPFDLYGCYHETTRFDIVRHGGKTYGYECFGGFYELLEIKDAGERCGIVISAYNNCDGYEFYEFASLEDAKDAWRRLCNLEEAPGLVRAIRCGFIKPWFYARAGEMILQDQVASPWLEDHPTYRMRSRFVVKDCLKNRRIKTCMGVKPGVDGRRLTVYWSDGTQSVVWEGEEARDIAPLNGRTLWQHEAMEKFQELLAGRLDLLTVQTPDGRDISIYVGELSPRKSPVLCSVQQRFDGTEVAEALVSARMIKIPSEKKAGGSRKQAVFVTTVGVDAILEEVRKNEI